MMEIAQKLENPKNDHNSLIFHATSLTQRVKCPEFSKELSFSWGKTLKSERPTQVYARCLEDTVTSFSLFN